MDALNVNERAVRVLRVLVWILHPSLGVYCRGGPTMEFLSAYEMLRPKNGGNIVNMLFRWEVSADGVATELVVLGASPRKQ